MPPKRGHGDLSLKCKGGMRTIGGEGRVENGNSHWIVGAYVPKAPDEWV